MRLLHALSRDGDQTMTELAVSLGVTQRRITALVDALVGDGLVQRRPHATDGRSTVVSITDAGAIQQAESWEQFQANISTVFADLTPEQQRQLIEITPVLTEALQGRTAALPVAD